MSTTVEPSADAPAIPRGALFPKLGSLLAFVPLGAWTTFHLWENMSAWQGAVAWESRVTAPKAPVLEVLTSLLVLAPLVLHTVWGLRRLSMSRPNLGRYPTFDNIKYVLQRLSALGILAFLPAHIFLARIKPALAGHHETFADITQQMRFHTPTLVVYVLGILGVSYHLANGLATGGMTWGFAASPRAMRRMNALSIVFFLLLATMGYVTVFAMYVHGERAAAAQVSASATPAAH